MPAPPLPIDDALPALRDALRTGGAAVLQAPPGAGKTTRVPLALLDEAWLGGAKIVMLEPRRLAARAAARRMATTLGEHVGDTVGHRVRMDTRVGPRTRIEVVTEGVLTRMLRDDATLENVGLVIFDEFHERNLQADLGLALTLQTRAILRPELRLLVMSATLDGERVSALIDDAPIVTSAGRAFPIDIRYVEPRVDGRIEQSVAAAVRDAIANDSGDVLVFLPGAGEIRRVANLLGDAGRLGRGVRIAPLFGNLSQEEQDRAIESSAPGTRKIVLSTAIAETSLTIEGVRVVIDCGLSRVPRFSPRTGMTRLETVRVSRASAAQRAGRAGRVAPGVCYRLWPALDQGHLVEHATPEIVDADLASLALDLAAAGVVDPAELMWLDAPPAASFAQARELLAELEAIDDSGRITEHGRRMSAMSLHPRLAHMVLRAHALGGPRSAALACDIAALLAERDVLRGEGAPPDADVRIRLDLLRGDAEPEYARGASVDRDALRRVRDEARQLRAQLRRELGVEVPNERGDSNECGLLLAFAYPDRIAQRRQGASRYVLRNGLSASFGAGQTLAESAHIVAAELDGKRPESRIYLAAPVEIAEIVEQFGSQIAREDVVEWDSTARGVTARRRDRLGAIVLRDIAIERADATSVTRALLDGIAKEGIDVLPWSDASRGIRERVAFLHRGRPDDWPDVSDDALIATLDEWLGPHLHGVKRLDDDRIDLTMALMSLVGWPRRAMLDEHAPTHIALPRGHRARIDYSDPDAPVLAARIQDLFGLAETPRIAGGTVPLTMHLLSPARRPVQVTKDLASFWRTTYAEVRKDLRGRYPKHEWPEEPGG
ncbi:MAG: ATP-dependent helicase HrpB [Gemmatimonadota bacterium]|nr:ATP-dependent helicase HrpB [Gemmatimonadota bacterium]